MRKIVFWSAAGIALAVAATATATVLLLQANQLPTNTSVFSVRLFENGAYQSPAHEFEWTSNAIAANSNTNINAMFSCPSTSTEVFAFLSLRGQETDSQSGWQAFAPTAFNGTSKNVLTANLKPAGLINGNPGAIYSRDHGGDFSLGLACTHAAGKIVDTVSYRFISVEAHTGRWHAHAEPVIGATKD